MKFKGEGVTKINPKGLKDIIGNVKTAKILQDGALMLT